MGEGHIVREILNVWNGVIVRHLRSVESAKISTGAPRTVGFLHHVKGGGPRRITLPDDAGLLHPLKLGLSSGILLGVQAARRAGVEMGGPFVSK